MNSNIEKIIDRAFYNGNISDLYICLGNYKSGDIFYEYESIINLIESILI